MAKNSVKMKPNPEEMRQLVPQEGLILLGYRGSHCHGTYEPPEAEFSTDDIDLMGVAIGPPEHYFGLDGFLGHKGVMERVSGPWDVVSYELRKFVGLLSKANPNVLSLLWLDHTMYLVKTPVGEILVKNRDLFASKLIYKAFTGYAYQQLYKMEHNATEGYMGEKRKKLIQRFGYDTKNAAHCIRLYRMGIEYLNTGELNVFRNDRRELLEIKHGKWTLEQVKEEAKRLKQRAEDAFDRCTLPAQPDMGKINAMLVQMIRDHVEMDLSIY